MIHKLKVYLLSRRNTILLFVGMTTIITTLVLVFASLVHLHNQSKQNERILKGLSCILLILPENRTQEKVSECIKVNDRAGESFLFETLDDPKKVDVSAEPVNDDKSLFIVPIKGDKGDKGDTVVGPQGPPGVSIKGDKGDAVVIHGEDGAPGEPGPPGREVEFRYNEAKQRIEWRYVGDGGWQVLIDQCVLTNTCEVDTP